MERKFRSSPALGFTFDSTPVKTEYVAVQNVLAEYKVSLENGALDVDSTLPEFRNALKDAGIEAIIAENRTSWINGRTGE